MEQDTSHTIALHGSRISLRDGARLVNGAYYDELGYGILREEWDTRYPGGFAAHLPQEQPLDDCSGDHGHGCDMTSEG